jgi:hypothetical protein
VQHKLNKQFTRDVEESIYRRGLDASPMLSLTLTPRLKRATRALVRFNRTIGKVIEKKDKGKERQI